MFLFCSPYQFSPGDHPHVSSSPNHPPGCQSSLSLAFVPRPCTEALPVTPVTSRPRNGIDTAAAEMYTSALTQTQLAAVRAGRRVRQGFIMKIPSLHSYSYLSYSLTLKRSV